MAIENARELYTRRSEGVSLWGALGADHRLSPDEKDPLFAPADDKVYRHASLRAARRSRTREVAMHKQALIQYLLRSATAP
jgi:phenylacetate-CoA oxygenase PaaH subunit